MKKERMKQLFGQNFYLENVLREHCQASGFPFRYRDFTVVRFERLDDELLNMLPERTSGIAVPAGERISIARCWLTRGGLFARPWKQIYPAPDQPFWKSLSQRDLRIARLVIAIETLYEADPGTQKLSDLEHIVQIYKLPSGYSSIRAFLKNRKAREKDRAWEEECRITESLKQIPDGVNCAVE